MGGSDGTVTIDTELDSKGAESGLNKLGSKLGSFAGGAAKVVAGGIAASATAVGALAKESLDAYANYEQLVGGVETLFGAGGQSLEEYANSVGKSAAEATDEFNKKMQAQDEVLKHADNAYKTCGMNANEYMETVTSFSASLLQSVGNDSEVAAQKSDAILTDMSDNASKMGTNMEMIQNAYNGFSKQNYTINKLRY